MPRVTAERVKETKRELLDAAQQVLLEEGYSGLSTRRVAEAAGTQMSQIQYHFGSKEGMILALFEYLNDQLIDRQTKTFANPELNVSEKWALSCDYLDDDIGSGYVRVLMELTAAGWSNPAIGAAVRSAYADWRNLILTLTRQVEEKTGSLGPFSAEDIGALVSAAFIGSEAAIMLDYESPEIPFRQALRRFGKVIEFYESLDVGG
ncbi:TetR/AcrR family transcriptional regulator [Boseongicola aestuarii]|uniref:HTH-type transcriptional repressor AcnR n=1 Tax=Boseongicola aestuarii TaxID=1470561 RepID=A0A238IZQ2_9RHOB|nr:TetR/AcrR family transcriptional regulator [Boseongicola aestuarii]SMX23365.1 HTH-type transcriptional repressor AcnR [Boseongicola aestuarii]